MKTSAKVTFTRAEEGVLRHLSTLDRRLQILEDSHCGDIEHITVTLSVKSKESDVYLVGKYAEAALSAVRRAVKDDREDIVDKALGRTRQELLKSTK